MIVDSPEIPRSIFVNTGSLEYVVQACIQITFQAQCPILYIFFHPANKRLKGLSHAILGNFSIDQVVIELTEITK